MEWPTGPIPGDDNTRNPVAAKTHQLTQRAFAFDVTAGDVIEHRLPGGEVALRQTLPDRRLPCQQAVDRFVTVSVHIDGPAHPAHLHSAVSGQT